MVHHRARGLCCLAIAAAFLAGCDSYTPVQVEPSFARGGIPGPPSTPASEITAVTMDVRCGKDRPANFGAQASLFTADGSALGAIVACGETDAFAIPAGATIVGSKLEWGTIQDNGLVKPVALYLLDWWEEMLASANNTVTAPLDSGNLAATVTLKGT